MRTIIGSQMCVRLTIVDRVHGGQQLRLFNAYYDDYGFQPPRA
jgi:hypothetical protein